MNKNTIEPDLNEEDLKDTLFNDSFAMSGEEMALTLDHLNHQLQQLSDIIKTYNQIHFKDKASQLDCICALIERVIPEGSRKMLLHAIRETGYENIQKAFIALNQVCEDINHEKEDLFFILKRHRLNFPSRKKTA